MKVHLTPAIEYHQKRQEPELVALFDELEEMLPDGASTDISMTGPEHDLTVDCFYHGTLIYTAKVPLLQMHQQPRQWEPAFLTAILEAYLVHISQEIAETSEVQSVELLH